MNTIDFSQVKPGVISLGSHSGIIQSMLDYAYSVGQEPNVLAIVGAGRKQERFFWGEAEICLTWLASGLNQQATPFEQTAYFQDLEDLKEFLSSQAKHGKRTGQPALL